jgi:hypothetical protein
MENAVKRIVMTINSIPSQKSNHLTICRKHLAITGSDLLINSIATLTIFEIPSEMYRMHNNLKIAGRQEATGGEG